MKLLTITVPCYNSQEYMRKAVDSLLPGGDEVEILIVDDGSTDETARIAEDYEKRWPGIVRALHKENGGHGDAVMTGLREASGLYFKVVDSDDWLDSNALCKVLETLRSFRDQPIDMLISHYIYDKVCEQKQHTVTYHVPLPVGRVFSWEETRRFRLGQYLLMHAVIYRTEMLRKSGMVLPKHTFYVDDLYVYVPLRYVNRIYYLDVDLYHYFIGRQDQSVQEEVLMRRIDQYLLVNRLMISQVDPYTVEGRKRQQYMLNFLEIITTVSSVMLVKIGTEESMRKKKELWAYIEKENPRLYRELRRRLLGRIVHLPGGFGRAVMLTGYRISRKIVSFN